MTSNSLGGQRSDLTSDLKFMAQITYTIMFVWTVLTFFDQSDRKKKERKKEERTFSSTRVAGASLPQLKMP